MIEMLLFSMKHIFYNIILHSMVGESRETHIKNQGNMKQSSKNALEYTDSIQFCHIFEEKEKMQMKTKRKESVYFKNILPAIVHVEEQ